MFNLLMGFCNLMVVVGGLWFCSVTPYQKVKKTNAFDRADMRKCSKTIANCGKNKGTVTTVVCTIKAKVVGKVDI